MTVLEFINVVRRELGLPSAISFDLHAAIPGSESACLLALAMGCRIGGAHDPDRHGGAPIFVMRFPSVAVARGVSAATGREWCNPLPCVELPDELADIACAFDGGEPADSSTWGRAPVSDAPLALAA